MRKNNGKTLIRVSHRKSIEGGGRLLVGVVAGAARAAGRGQDEVLVALGLKRLSERHGIGFVGEGVLEDRGVVVNTEKAGQGDQVLRASSCSQPILDIAHGNIWQGNKKQAFN